MRDKLKSYNDEADDVLTLFERLLLALTRHQLADYATFTEDGRNFILHQAPEPDIPTGRYFFKSSPQASAHQYRFNSPLGQ